MMEMSTDESGRSAADASESVGERNTTRMPLPADSVIGARIRDRRIAVGMSQQALASKIGISFQQLQKYEKGINRVGASRLHALAAILETTPDRFFAVDNEHHQTAILPAPSWPFDTSSVAASVRNRRKALGLNQKALAEKAGVGVRLIQRYEQGEYNIRASSFLAIARALNMLNELSTPNDDTPTSDDAALYAASAEGIQLNLAVAAIADPATRWRVIQFAEELNRSQSSLEPTSQPRQPLIPE